jgi:hypothetical protein
MVYANQKGDEPFMHLVRQPRRYKAFLPGVRQPQMYLAFFEVNISFILTIYVNHTACSTRYLK